MRSMITINNTFQPRMPSASTQPDLSDNEMKKISELIYQRAGIVLTSQKRDMVYNRLSRRLRELNLQSFSEYIYRLELDHKSDEWQAFINTLTTNLTSFFRESYHFPLLAEHARQYKSNYSVWCAAASTGEEPCSIAMTLDDTLGRSISGPRIWATDIDTNVLDKAEKGIYRLADIDALTTIQKKNYFLRGTGTQADLVKTRKELLDQICYQQLNLLEDKWDVPAPFNAIFCRNVMIYFDQKTQEKLMNRFSRMLKPGGILFAGHSEHFNYMNIPFRLRGQSVYYLDQDRK